MYQFAKKLSNTKRALKCCNRDIYGPIHSNIAGFKRELKDAHIALQLNPSDSLQISTKRELRLKYLTLLEQEEKFARQKSRQLWLQAGDSNTKFFYNSIKARSARNTISQLWKQDGSYCTEPEEVKDHIIQYYHDLLN
ncbi:hypothetical protein QJS10_CPB14g01211 [Acorus calamus]|uniref:Uncharacterized protein n=1 Tax=Acorus calamus TaxID=4465 RepID=A0AAV9DA94_ACOCL|nr:hypothetical protein QJS10_CPB14g01211 [Acorus calamus]